MENKVFETCALDNTMCEYAFKEGFTHILYDDNLYVIVESEKYGYDWQSA